jgi:hypothetical protein
MNAHCQIAGQPKAPEDWRTPKRFALFMRRQNSRQRFGLRRTSAAFARRAQLRMSLSTN